MSRLAPLALAGALAACTAQRPAEAPPEGVVTVSRGQLTRGRARVVTAADGPLARTLVAAGRVAFDEGRVQHVLPPVSGQIARVLASPGDRVAPGAPLATLLSPDAASAFSDVAKAQADATQVSADLTRQERLAGVGAASARDLEAAQDADRKARAELARASQRAALLRRAGFDAVTQELTLRSAIAGEVIARAAGPGLQVQGSGSGGTPAELFTIGDVDRVWVLADVDEAALPRVEPGARATVRVTAWPTRVFTGAVERVATTLDPALRTGRVRLSLDNRDRALAPEMLARVEIEAAPGRGVTVPREAVTSVDGQTFVYVAAPELAPRGDAQAFRQRRVRVTTEPGADRVIVTAGLRAGERVLVEEAPSPAEAQELHLSAAQFERAGLRLTRVAAEPVARALTLSGRVAFDDARVAHVYAPVSGRVTRLLAEPGQHVARGAPLAVLASPDLGAAVADALKAEADEAAAAHERARQAELVTGRAGAPRDLEAAEAAWLKASAELDRARGKARLLGAGSWDAVRQELTLRSPIDGEVVARTASPGLEVQGQWGGAGNPVELFTVGALDPLWIVGDVSEADLPLVRPGQLARITFPAFPDRTFEARVAWRSSALDPATRTGKVRCALPNPGGRLRPEMAPVLTVDVPERPRLAVPRTAVLRLGDEQVVFVAAGKSPDGQLTFLRRTVRTGDDAADGTVAILDGLAPGEEVVSTGAIYLVGLL